MKMEIFYASSYTRREKGTQKLSRYMLNLIVSGFEYMRVYDASARRIDTDLFPEEITGNQPFLILLPPGVTLEFSAGEKRENWAILLSLPSLEVKTDPLEYLYDSSTLLPYRKVEGKKLHALRETFSAVAECISSGHLSGMTKGKLLTCSILSELISLPAGSEPETTPEAALKKALDEDVHFEHSIGELNRRLGLCSLPYMRKRFQARYGLLPCRYRNNIRLNRIMELFSQSDLSLKMIADEVGMKHLEHLYCFLQTRQDLSPKALMDQLRGRKIPFKRK